MRSRSATTALTALLASWAVTVGTAAAAYPGSNGSLAARTTPPPCDSFTDNDPCGGDTPSSLLTIAPRSHRTRSVQIGGFIRTATWSPDGSRLLALIDPDVEPQPATLTLIRREDVTRLGLTPLMGTPLAGSEDVVGATWAPDGNRIAVVQRGLLFTSRPDGTDRHVVADHVDAKPPAWSTRGQIAFFRGGDLVSVSAASGGPEVRLTFGGATDVSWSPSGDQLCFARRRSVFLLDATGHGRRLLARRAITPRWSPDGRSIAFVRVRPKHMGSTLHVTSVNPGARSRPILGREGRRLQPTVVDGLLDWRPAPRRAEPQRSGSSG